MSAKTFLIRDIDVHMMDSRVVGQTYQIQVMQPLVRRGKNTLFPVLYLTDGNSSFEFAKGISQLLQAAGEVVPYILVGIGYPGHDPRAGNILRRRDFTSERRAAVPCLPTQSPIEGVWGIEPGRKSWHGAREFLSFVREELQVFIDERYPTDPGDRAYAGHSLGGGLGLHALFSQGDLFKRYVIASASIAYDGDEYGIREASDFIATGKRLDARLFMAVGEQEEFDPIPAVAKPQFVSSFYKLAALLRGARVPGLDFSCRVFPGETHASVWPIAFSHGVRAVYGPAERPPMSSS